MNVPETFKNIKQPDVFRKQSFHRDISSFLKRR